MKIRINLRIENVREFAEEIVSRYHFREEDLDDIIFMYEQIKRVMTPYAQYRINQDSTGVALIDRGLAAVCAMTLGNSVDVLQERYIKEENLVAAYMLDCISGELLLRMYREFNESYSVYHRRYVSRYIFIGEEIPLTSMREILEYVNGGAKSEIKANEYGVLTPSKSVVFYALLSENPASKCFGICQNCGNANCENRYTVKQLPEHKKYTVDEKEKKKMAERSYGYRRIFGS